MKTVENISLAALCILAAIVANLLGGCETARDRIPMTTIPPYVHKPITK